MQKHHYLPASFLARFSTDVTKSVREKVLFVGDKETGKIFKSSTGKTGCINNLYTVTWGIGKNKEFIEQLWNNYENNLSQSINKLINGTIDGLTWARVLVPFVACMFVRGPDFNLRFKRRLDALGVGEQFDYDDNTNQARLIELQRLLGPVSVAKWIVVNTLGDENLITNDLGYSPFINLHTGDRGVAIPLGLRYVLAIVPQIERKIISIKDGKWVPMIEYTTDFPGNHENLNESIAGNSQRLIFGNDANIIGKYLIKNHTEILAPEPYELGFITDPLARAHEFTWHRLVAALEKKPIQVHENDFPLDWEVLQKGWMPMLFFPTNLIEFPPALEKLEDGINVKFYNPEFYYLLSRVIMYFEGEAFSEAASECTNGLNSPFPSDKKYRLYLARSAAFEKMNKFDESIKDLYSAIDIDPGNPLAYSDLGVMLMKKVRFDEALDILTTAIAIGPDFGLAYFNRGSAYANIGDYEKAALDFSRSIDFLPNAPEKADAYSNRGNVFSTLNRYDEAICDYSKAIELYKPGDEKAFSYYRRAVVYDLKNSQFKTLNDLQQALLIKQNYFEAHTYLANVLARLGRIDDAISAMSAALPIFSDSKEKATLYFERGLLFSEEGKLKEGLSDFEIANQLTPDDPTTLYNIGVSYLFFARLSEALNCFDKSLGLRPYYPEALNDHGVAQSCLRKYNESIDDFKQAITYFQENSGKASALRNMALSLALTQQFDLAEEALHEAEKFEPESVFLFQTKGQLAYYREQFEEALVFHKIAHKKLICVKKKNFYMILPLIHLGKQEEAQNLFHSFLKNKPLQIDVVRMKNELTRAKDLYPALTIINEIIAHVENFAD